jgi:hypothetical protein
MISKFYDFSKSLIGGECRYDESFLFHLFAIERIEFESMTMAFGHRE